MHANVDIHGIARDVRKVKLNSGGNMLAFNVHITKEYKGQISTKIIPVAAFFQAYNKYQNSPLEGAEVMVKGTLSSKANEYNGNTYYRVSISVSDIEILNAAAKKSQWNNEPQDDGSSDMDIPF